MNAHRIASLFPLLDGEGFKALVESVRVNGLRDPIITYQGEILDGRNRHRACLVAGVEPRFVEWSGEGSPWSFVWDANAVRRHLDEGQRAAIKLKFLRGDAEWQAEQEAKRRKANEARAAGGATQGHRGAEGGRGNKKTPPVSADTGGVSVPERVNGDASANRTRNDLAKQAGTSPSTAARVLALETKAPDLFEKVALGEVNVSNAYGQMRRTEKAKVVASKPAPPPDGPYDVLVLDPPWAYEKHGTDATYRSQNPYPDMTVDEIRAIRVNDFAERDCILWLWTTNAFMREALACVPLWGFAEKTILTWVKDRMGTGAWLRGRTEHCIMAVRGKPVVTLTNQTTVIDGPLREHSRKPHTFYALVESLCPGSKLEMFARETRPGWTSWGAEAAKFDHEDERQELGGAA